MVLCEGSANNETWIDRGTRSSTVVQRSRHHVIYGGGGRRSYGRGPLGLRLGLCALPWRVAAHFVARPMRPKVADLQVFPPMARPGLEPGTPRFSDVRASRSNPAKTPATRGIERRSRKRATPANSMLSSAIREMDGDPSPDGARSATCEPHPALDRARGGGVEPARTPS